MIVKLVKLRDNTSRQLSNLELLMNAVFGNSNPTKFVPGNEYIAGDKVYVENDDGDIEVKECVKDGVYNDVNNDGWKGFEVSASESKDSTTDSALFSPGNYVVGDRQVVVGDNGEITVYECIKDGYYSEITEDGWKVLPFSDDTPDENEALLDSTVKVNVSQYIEDETYESGEVVYVVDNTTGSVTLYENTSSSPTSEVPPAFPWDKLNASEYIIDGELRFATDEDIMEMFGVDKMPECDCDDKPDAPPVPDDDDIEWEEF